MIYYNKGRVPKAQVGVKTQPQIWKNPIEKRQWEENEARRKAYIDGTNDFSDVYQLHAPSLFDGKETMRNRLREWHKEGKYLEFDPETLMRYGTVQSQPAVNGPRKTGIGSVSQDGRPLNADGSPVSLNRPGSPAATATSSSTMDPNFDYNDPINISQYTQPAQPAQPTGTGTVLRNPEPEAKKPATGDADDYYRNDEQRKADPSSVADGPKDKAEGVNTSPYKDYLSELSIDEVSDIVKYGVKKGYNKEQINSMMDVAVEQTELAEKYGYKDKIDGIAGMNTRASRAARASALERENLAKTKEAEVIAKEVAAEEKVADEEPPATIYSPSEIRKAYRKDRRADRADRINARTTQRRSDRSERRELDESVRREDRILDRQARRNTARHSRVDDRGQRNDVRDQMMRESEDFPAIDRFKTNIEEQAGVLRKGGIFYKK